tara:strand:+ start:331 stop:1986 length:1656 start_codon:yes stop_codon:yes gene_type:complete
MPGMRESQLLRLSALKREVTSWLQHWMDLSEYILPRRGRFFTTDRNKGDVRNKKIIDNTGTLAARALASGMMSGVTSPARPWFRLTLPDPDMADDPGVKVWLDDVQRLLLKIFASSNLYNGLHSLYDELGTFGTSCMLLLEDYEDVVRAHLLPIGSYYLGTDDRGEVDTVYREFQMQVGQVVSQFTLAKCSPEIQALYASGDQDSWIDVIHCIERNKNQKRNKQSADGMPWLSCYFEKGSGNEQYLSVKGFHEKPFMAPRWAVTGNDIYGRSPGMDALGDVKQLQDEQKHKATAIAKKVSPPMVGPGSLAKSPSNTLPGGVTYVDALQGQQGFTPAYQVNLNINELSQDIQEVQHRISRAFYEDLFLMLANSDRRQITAREVEERHEEKLLMLGPVLERLQDELLDPLIDRVFAMALRADILPEVPPQLEGIEMRVEYISIMAQAQKMIGTASVERLAGFAGNLAAANEEVLDKINFDELIDAYSDMLGTPGKLVRDEDAVQAIRDGRAQQAQMAQQAEMMGQGAQAAKVMSETDTSRDDTLLNQVMGGAF